MILDVLPLLRGARIVLASASPRRSEMLRSLGLVLRDGGSGGGGGGSGSEGRASFEVMPSRFEETLEKQAFASAAEYAKATAAGKGYRLTGTRTQVPFGPVADAFLVPAETDSGTAVFVVG